LLTWFSCGKLAGMTGVGTQFGSLRLSSPEMRRLGLALALSLALHLFVWGAYESGKKLGVWRRLHLPAWLQLVTKTKTRPPAELQNIEESLTFVEVTQPTTEAPKSTPYYSSQNSLAADPTKGNKDVPQLKGKQTEVPKTETVPRPDYNKLQVAIAAPQQNTQPAAAVPQPKTQPLVQPGDLTLGKPQDSKPQEQPRPRTLKQAREQQGHQMPGQEMKQEGGARLHARGPSFDVAGKSFGAYDQALIDAVTQRWYDLLNSRQFAMDRTGKVMLRFHLNYDGTITEMSVLQNTVGELLGYVCQNAVNDPAPFAKWPSDMRRMVGKNYREITFTFYYF
jgi:outer membrane biosynthesis protein TonB